MSLPSTGLSLSYTARLICLLVVVAGAVHLTLQVALAAASKPILRWLEKLSTRHRERLLCWVQIGPFFFALLFSLACCLPEYVLHECNHSAEDVSGWCLLLSLAVVAWFAWPAAKALRLAWRTLWFSRTCQRIGTRLNPGAGGIPVIVVPGAGDRVALVGLVRPSILISHRLVGSGGLEADALAAALDHERAHAAQRHNWKLLAMHSLPRVVVRFGNGATWMQLWRQAAEWSADDDAAGGDPERALVLAETLVRVARLGSQAATPMIQTTLCCEDADLAARVQRLIAPTGPARQDRMSIYAVWWRAAIAGMAAAAAISPWLYGLSERLLHLG